MSEVRGYKVFKSDWTCSGFQYEVGQTFEENVTPECCNRGFHFCTNIADCFKCYDNDQDNKIAEVIALGDVDHSTENSVCCTNKIQIVREITQEELYKLANIGNSCTGLFNAGICNAGDWNTGDCNTGDCNAGNGNTGSLNTGNGNTGSWNTGNWNAGSCNTGNCNTGSWNTGNWNTGDWNTGNRNTGNRNAGNRNTGDWNTGDWNTGDWNKSSFNNGCFMTEEPIIMMFNKPSNWTYRDWLYSDARHLLNQIQKNVVEWVCSENMTDKEKAAHPTYKTTGGYLRVLVELPRPIEPKFNETWILQPMYRST